MLATQLHTLSGPFKVHRDHNLTRSPAGRFLPREIRDPLGRRLVPLDLFEVERRLKARAKRDES